MDETRNDTTRDQPSRQPASQPASDAAAPVPEGAGPHAPGSVGGTKGEGPESGGYSGEPGRKTPDNRKGGFGAG